MKRLFVSNIHVEADEAAIRGVFAIAGCAVSGVKLCRKQSAGRTRCFAFVDVPDDQAAAEAIADLDGVEFKGRKLNVQESRNRDSLEVNSGGPGFSGAVAGDALARLEMPRAARAGE